MVKGFTKVNVITKTIEETVEYAPFHDAWCAYKVRQTITGRDSSDFTVYGIAPLNKFEAALRTAAKSRKDGPYIIAAHKHNEIGHWIRLTKTDMKKVLSPPDMKKITRNSYGLLNIFRFLEEAAAAKKKDKDYSQKTFAKLYAEAKRGGDLLYKFDHSSWKMYDADGGLVLQPVRLDFGYNDREFDMKKLITFLRTRDDITLDVGDAGNKEFPELIEVPYYNRDTSGAFEVKGWWKPTAEYAGCSDVSSIAVYLFERNVVSLEECRLPQSVRDRIENEHSDCSCW